MVGKGTRARSRPAVEAARRTPVTGPSFELLASKLAPPRMRSKTVGRSDVLERLSASDGAPIVSIVAPAGYGKTTLLATWAERNGHDFAWVSADEQDNDPKVLLTYIAAALDRIEPVDPRVFEALASPGSSAAAMVIPRLARAFASRTRPVVLVLDDVHLLHARECQAAVAVLADHVPAGSRIALASRAKPPLRLARLRAEGRVLEIGPEDLSLDLAASESLLRDAGVSAPRRCRHRALREDGRLARGVVPRGPLPASRRLGGCRRRRVPWRRSIHQRVPRLRGALRTSRRSRSRS